ncbi:MAG: hypothetical protein KJ077_11185 [Anaerolineae bacterium]|nr:hypothetical protein [Anaerolineae bacterium]
MKPQLPIRLLRWSHVTQTACNIVDRFELYQHEHKISLQRGDDTADGGVWELRVGETVIALSERFKWYDAMVYWEKKMKSLRSIINKQRRLERAFRARQPKKRQRKETAHVPA